MNINEIGPPQTQPLGGFFVRQISFDDVQLLRFWRNSEGIRQFMADRSVIAPKAQRDWYLNIDWENEHRFIYGLGSLDVGAIHAELSDLSFEVGIMCGNPALLGHWVNLVAALYIYDLAFIGFGKEVAFATIRKENLPSLRLSMALGFVEDESVAEGLLRFRLYRENYLMTRVKFRKYLCWRG